jgi:hypothetical protein
MNVLYVYVACALYWERTGGYAYLSSLCMSHLLVKYNRNHTCLVSSLS